MIHIFKHSDGTFDRATVRKGRYIHGSNQHYSKKSAVISSINIDRKDFYSIGVYVQDDTGDKPILMYLSSIGFNKCDSQPKRMKKYIPNNNKSKK